MQIIEDFSQKMHKFLKIAWTTEMTLRLLAPQSHRLAPIHFCVRENIPENRRSQIIQMLRIHLWICSHISSSSLFITKKYKNFFPPSTWKPDFCVSTKAFFFPNKDYSSFLGEHEWIMHWPSAAEPEQTEFLEHPTAGWVLQPWNLCKNVSGSFPACQLAPKTCGMNTQDFTQCQRAIC